MLHRMIGLEQERAQQPLQNASRVIVGISGATGIAYGVRILKVLRAQGIETHLVVSKAGERTRALEVDITSVDLKRLATHSYSISDIAAPIASGSFKTLGMIVAPCSMRTLGEIAAGTSSTLLTRAADVMLKERRPLVLLARESPLSLIHLRNMLAVTEAGATVMPPSVAFYVKPRSIEEAVEYQVARVLDQLGLQLLGVPRWGESEIGCAWADLPEEWEKSRYQENEIHDGVKT